MIHLWICKNVLHLLSSILSVKRSMSPRCILRFSLFLSKFSIFFLSSFFLSFLFLEMTIVPVNHLIRQVGSPSPLNFTCIKTVIYGRAVQIFKLWSSILPCELRVDLFQKIFIWSMLTFRCLTIRIEGWLHWRELDAVWSIFFFSDDVVIQVEIQDIL